VSGEAAFELVRLRNGACSVRDRVFGEVCHPGIGPAAEAEALYVRQLRLPERMRSHAGAFVVWDVGLGAAANALAALRCARAAGCSLRLVSFDATLGPLAFALGHAAELGYFGAEESLVRRLLADRRVVDSRQDATTTWEVVEEDFPAFIAGRGAEALPGPDAILFDPFSPAANPAMWTLAMFARLRALVDPARPCALATYSRSTMTRAALLLGGWFVGVGDAVGAKEETTVAASTLALVARPLDRAWLERAARSDSGEPLEGPAYRRAPLSAERLARLRAHPQFQ
jgi:tRNA U34 5-methylaminomethyl-2-thiouridine-forming methyltransferase MnmC